MNPNQIELLAVNAVEDFFAKIERINPMIPLADKEPSWDGFLYLYPDDSNEEGDEDRAHTSSSKRKKQVNLLNLCLTR